MIRPKGDTRWNFP